MKKIDSPIEHKYKRSKSIFNNRTEWLDSKHAAEYLCISVENLRVKISRGQISVDGKIGNSLRFKRRELDKLLETSLTRGEFQ